MKSSDLIAAFLMEALEKQDGALELQRNELAQQFNVVPSQINYVISSRFTP
ncbi:MAG: CtsR family transcriptional regulator, partial [Clostridia bacterium]|nr:CtsR family transcriptional regulator [Clostridia bacterium]